MHDLLRAKALRILQSLPEEQVRQAVDYLEFLESRHGCGEAAGARSGFQKLGARLEDRLRRARISPSAVLEAFQLLATAERAVGGASKMGKWVWDMASPPSRGGPPERDGEEVRARKENSDAAARGEAR